jgi:epoxyqueuosine reductase
MSLEAQIKARAVELGFDLCGITTGTPPKHNAAYRQWLADGCHGDMRYMTRRLDPEQILPGCRSIIVVGLNYWALTEQRPPEGGAPSPPPRVARFAAGTRDYHDVMGEKLKELAKLVDGLWYVDTGPILERDLAQRAGIGWIGKHTNLINRHFGNWILLGEILTTRELVPDAPEREHCGKCRRCLDACPTGAITAPYRLDARRCISYLTIELKGGIPEEFRSKIGDRVFGCDACLEVCPWNRFAKPSTWKPRPLPPLVEMLSWTEQQFADYVRGTPLYRLKRTRFLRNVCVVLGNRGDVSALPVLERAALDSDPLVREHAVWAATRLRKT